MVVRLILSYTVTLILNRKEPLFRLLYWKVSSQQEKDFYENHTKVYEWTQISWINP